MNTLKKPFLSDMEYGFCARTCEVILSFIISQNNGIPRIKKIIETLSSHYGSKIGEYGKYTFRSLRRLPGQPLTI